MTTLTETDRADVAKIHTYADAYECGRYARSMARQMLNAIVESRFHRVRGRGHLALFSRIEADQARRAFHKMLTHWRDEPGFLDGYHKRRRMVIETGSAA